MNIFYLDENPEKCAKAHYDTHVRKMIVESAQMLSTAHRVLDGYSTIQLNKANRRMTVWKLDDSRDKELYKSTHVNHPCSLWVRESIHNYLYLYRLMVALINEFDYRWGKTHATSRLINTLAIPPKNISKTAATPFKIATTPNNREKDPVIAYRNYYMNEKLSLYGYTKREQPNWFIV